MAHLKTDKEHEAGRHRIGGARLRTALLLLVAAVWLLSVHGQTAAAADDSRGAGTAVPVAGANAASSAPYLSAGVALIRSQATRFVDGADAGDAALYGSRHRFDAGDLGDDLQFLLAVGARLPYRLRAQLEFGLARGLDWRGNTNYRASGGRQPSEATLDTRHFLLAGFHDFPGWEIAPGRPMRPFLGAGLGVTGYRLGGYAQRFPEPDDPQGSLRRGPGGQVPFTALPGGSGRNFTWRLTAGIAIPVGARSHLDLSYRYTDAGEIRTDAGDIAIVRYREEGARREIPVCINETTADYRTHALLAALRFEF